MWHNCKQSTGSVSILENRVYQIYIQLNFHKKSHMEGFLKSGHIWVALICSLYIAVPYPPENKPPSPPFLAEDMAQTGEGLIFEYAQWTSNISPPPADITLAWQSTESTLVLSLQHSSKNWRYHRAANSGILTRPIARPSLPSNKLFKFISMLRPWYLVEITDKSRS